MGRVYTGPLSQPWQLVQEQRLVFEPQLAHAPALGLVANRLGHATSVSAGNGVAQPGASCCPGPGLDGRAGKAAPTSVTASASDALDLREMSRPAIALPPEPRNEPVKDYAPGSPERAELQQRLRELERERIEIPLVIGGKDVETGETFEAVMPHRKGHVLADVHSGGPAQVEQAISAAREARHDWNRMPWEERAAIFLRAAELLAGPWRATLNAATMLGQSKTAHQAEIDAACELTDFWRFNVEFMTRIYKEQPSSAPGMWNRLEYRPLEGFVFAVTPFNFTAIAGNLPAAPALMGNTVVWKPASTAAFSAYFLMRLLQEAGLPDGVINLVYGSGAKIGDAALASPELAGIHFTGSTAVFNSMWKIIRSNGGEYRNYRRTVGATGGTACIAAPP